MSLSDGAKHAWLYDVAVDEQWRGRHLGTALVQLTLDHPSLRTTRRIWLATRDAQRFYTRLGFVAVSTNTAPGRTYPSTTMLLTR